MAKPFKVPELAKPQLTVSENISKSVTHPKVTSLMVAMTI
jgi:hypothetical protein